MSSSYMSIEGVLRKVSLPERYFGGDFVIAEEYEEEKTCFFENFEQCDGSEFF
ncbi:MAG: hypothetical protein KBI40_02250 [Firmicutes bacterium]|nr:hypothetical protein [Candidatus Fermentithermobacillaceae bacterium]